MNDRQTELKEYSAHIFEMGCMEQRVYLKNDVDAVIAGLKRKLQDQCISCPVKMQEDDVVAEKDNEIRRLKRALWLARAERAHLKVLEYWPDYCHNAHCRIAEQKWDKVERKCRAKAEEYR